MGNRLITKNSSTEVTYFYTPHGSLQTPENRARLVDTPTSACLIWRRLAFLVAHVTVKDGVVFEFHQEIFRLEIFAFCQQRPGR
jgi:hypothetical protein